MGVLLFDLMDDGKGEMTARKLVQGIARLKGGSRSIDVIGLMHMTAHLAKLVSKISTLISNLDARMNRKLKWTDLKLEPTFDIFWTALRSTAVGAGQNLGWQVFRIYDSSKDQYI